MIISLLIFLLTFNLNVHQPTEINVALPVKDTLTSKSWEYLSQAVMQNNGDSLKSDLYLRAWLKKAKEKSDNHQMAQAYRNYSYKGAVATRLQYADSMVTHALQTDDNLLIGKAYLTKGIAHYTKRELKKALDNYLKANKYVGMTKDLDTKYMVKYTLGLTKYQIGFYAEAIALFNECLPYYEEENDRAYLNTLHALSLCYNKEKNYHKASEINALGINECEELSEPVMIPYFKNAEGINQFSLGNYSRALQMLLQSIPHLQEKNDFSNESITSYYIGKAFWELNEKEKAIPYLKKVDEIFQNTNFIQRDIRENYELLIDYKKDKHDFDGVLKYVNLLLQVDRTINEDHYYLIPKVIREYETPQLLEIKAQTERRLEQKNTTQSVVIAALSVIAILLIVRSHTLHKNYQTKFKSLMAHEISVPKKEKKEKDRGDAIADIRPEVIATVIENMKLFEANKTFLQNDLTQVKLADILETNTSYIPKIVYYATGKTTIDYICDLKIDFIIEHLKGEGLMKNYTLKGLGEAAGFGSTQRFTRAFKYRTGLGPVYFIAELKKSQNS